ncbi:phage shock protein PspA [Thalassotalea euphylliae]|uniref:Phage shock protein PspA n=1 Tax=Thalassotalea euphylliae TaxID=1655234 RepID=A0A3E0U290_9GAMM|nr:phage shock protein PspA [Thalassotalea euphylliae]REL30834.1 phage shock protein PspA [Thalassotalea euphylliae]REL34255.1 phage shock protein PspA [Thalassotalea euphylliae]
MGMFTRFADIINANINSMLDKAEQPEKMIRLIIQEMEETLVEVRSTAAKHIAEQKTINRQVASLEKSAASWQEKAELAISKGRDDLAKSALAEKHKVKQQMVTLQEEADKLEEFLASVQEDGQRLQTKLAEAKRRQEALLLRQESAEVRLKVREKSTQYNIDEAINRFERYQQKIERVEAEVEAYDMTQNQDLDSQFRALENDDNIDQELATLKQKVSNAA